MTDWSQYPAKVFHSQEDGGFIALASDLPGCSAFGATQTEALAELQSAIQAWVGAARAAGNPVPDPSPIAPEPAASGKVLVRMPRSMHLQLIQSAEAEGTSMNLVVVSLLARALAQQQVPTNRGEIERVSAFLQQHGSSTSYYKEMIPGDAAINIVSSTAFAGTATNDTFDASSQPLGANTFGGSRRPEFMN